MRRMLNPDKVIKSTKIADDKETVNIGKENFKYLNDAYFVNIQTLSQSGWEAAANLSVDVNGNPGSPNVGIFRNGVYTIGAFQNGLDVRVVVTGAVLDTTDYSISAEMAFDIENTTVEDVLPLIYVGGSESFDLYVIKD